MKQTPHLPRKELDAGITQLAYGPFPISLVWSAPCLFIGFILPDLPFRLPPVLYCSTVLAAPLLVEFIGTLGDLRGQIGRDSGFDRIEYAIREQFQSVVQEKPQQRIAVSLQISVRFFVPFAFNARMMVFGEPQARNPPTMRTSPSLILLAASAADSIGLTIIDSPLALFWHPCITPTGTLWGITPPEVTVGHYFPGLPGRDMACVRQSEFRLLTGFTDGSPPST